jgi:sugar phosphate isomerase/epimerase
MGEAASRFVANTYSYIQTLPVSHCLERLGRLGFRDFEVMMYPGHLWPGEVDGAARRTLRRWLADGGFGIVALNMPNLDLNVAAATSEMRSYTLAVLRSVIELSADLGAGGVVIGPGKANPLHPEPAARLLPRFRAALDALVPRAESLGTELYVENMPFAFLPRIRDLCAAIDPYGWEGLGLVYDVANGYFVGEDLAEALRLAAARLKLLHASDTHQDVYRHAPIGSGSVPFARVPPVLEEISYRGPVVLEIISADAERDLVAGSEKLAAIGWKSATPRRSVAPAGFDRAS